MFIIDSPLPISLNLQPASSSIIKSTSPRAMRGEDLEREKREASAKTIHQEKINSKTNIERIILLLNLNKLHRCIYI